MITAVLSCGGHHHTVTGISTLYIKNMIKFLSILITNLLNNKSPKSIELSIQFDTCIGKEGKAIISQASLIVHNKTLWSRFRAVAILFPAASCHHFRRHLIRLTALWTAANNVLTYLLTSVDCFTTTASSIFMTPDFVNIEIMKTTNELVYIVSFNY